MLANQTHSKKCTVTNNLLLAIIASELAYTIQNDHYLLATLLTISLILPIKNHLSSISTPETNSMPSMIPFQLTYIGPTLRYLTPCRRRPRPRSPGPLLPGASSLLLLLL